MKRALTLGLVLLATAVSAADLALATRHDVAPSREASSEKPQWAPSGNFSALHTRAVFRGESTSGTRPYARESRETAAAKSVWSYANLNPARFTDPDGRDAMPPGGYTRWGCEARNPGNAVAQANCMNAAKEADRRAAPCTVDPGGKLCLADQFGTGLFTGAIGALVCSVTGAAPCLIGAAGGVHLSGQPTLAAADDAIQSFADPERRQRGDWAHTTGVLIGGGGPGVRPSALMSRARPFALAIALESASMEVGEGALVRIGEIPPVPLSRVAPPTPIYLGIFSPVRPQPAISWEQAAAKARANVPPARPPDFIVGPGGPADTIAFQKLFSRTSWRDATAPSLWQKAAPGSSTVTRECPTCDTEVYRWTVTDKGALRQGFDINHRPTWHSRKLAAYIEYMRNGKLPTRSEVRDLYHEDLELQCGPCNQSNLFNDP